MSDKESTTSAHSTSSSRKSSSSKEKVLTTKNIFWYSYFIIKARRQRLVTKTKVEIKALSKERRFKSNTDFTTDVWKNENGEKIGYKCMFHTLTYEPITKFNSLQPAQLLLDFVNDKSQTEPPPNIFDGEEVLDIIFKIESGVFVPDDKHKHGGTEFYEIKWADLFVKFGDIESLPDDSIVKPTLISLYAKMVEQEKFKQLVEDNIIRGSNNQGSSSAPSALGVEPPIPDASESPENSSHDDNSLDRSDVEGIGKNQDNPGKRKHSMPNLNKSQPTEKVANKAIENLKKELSSYFALALSVFHFKECPKISTGETEIHFFVIMAHYVENDKTDYKVVTRLLAYKQIYDANIIELRSKIYLQDTIKNYDLGNKYLVIVSREYLKSIFSEINHKWLQCYNEALDSSLANLITSLPKPTVEIIQCPTELCENSQKILELTYDTLQQYLDELKLNFVPKTLKFASHIEHYVSLNNLTTIWFLCRNDLKNQIFPDSSWSVHFDSVCTDNLKKLEPIQLTACLLSPFDFKNWLNKSASGNFKFNDEHYKKIKIELEEFAHKIPVGHEVANDDDQQDDVESLMERPGYRQKLIKDDLIRVLPKDESKSQSSNDPKENESILDEVDRYKEKIKDETMWGDLTQFQFWEWQKNNFPKLSQAAMFYMSVPASVLPSVLLLKKTLKKAEADQTNNGSIEERLFAIFNDECAADESLINENKESEGEYSGVAEKRPRLDD